MSMASSKNLRKVVTKVLFLNQDTPTWRHIRNHSYTNVYMKWKSDSYFDSIESIHKSIQLKPIIALKNRITASPDSCIPVSDVSKKGIQLEIPIKVARFLRLYPSVFEEFTGPKYNLPWFRLTPEAAILHDEEQAVYRDFEADLQERLRKLILMSVENKLPLKIIKGMLWYLGLPEDYLDGNVDGCFKVVEMGDELKGLSAVQTEKTLSVIQKNALRTGVYNGGQMESISFPLFPSKGLRLRSKILDWLDGFQKLPYISPYEECLDVCPGSDLAEKRVVGLLHELLSLFVEHSAERKKLLCLRKYLGLPQKVHKVFERHPCVFYLSLRNNTCTAILKEAYCDKRAIEAHPLATVEDDTHSASQCL
ncbi:putative plant organelle RNA recognition domain-containing protein [Helianthus debilis subsp. tardiflorus]